MAINTNVNSWRIYSSSVIILYSNLFLIQTNFFGTWISCSRVWRPLRETQSEGASLILCSFLASWACRVLLQLSYLKILSVKQRVQHWIWWPPNSFDQYNVLYVLLDYQKTDCATFLMPLFWWLPPLQTAAFQPPSSQHSLASLSLEWSEKE